MTYAPLNDQSRLKNVEALDDDYLKAFTPKMLSGKWLDEYNSDSDEIYGVITENVGGNSVGDVIDATYMNVISEKLDYVDIEDYLENFKFEEIPVKIKIVGIIEDSSKILGFSNDSITNDNDFRSLYSECNKNDSESSHLIVSAEQMNKQGYKMTQSESRICIVNDNLTENEYTKLYRNIRQYGIITSLDDFRNNTTTYISSELIKLLPIFISLFILVIVSSVSISALNIKERIKEYGIFYICGSGWKSCILINFINNILTAITSFIITLIILNIMKISGFLGNTVITLGKWQLLVCGGIVVVNLLISLIMPIGIMRKNTPRGILMSNE